MALIKCRNCGKEISDKAPDCIHCGALIVKDERNDILQEEILKIKNEKTVLEEKNADFQNQLKEKEKIFEEEHNEKIKLAAEKNCLIQENSKLKNQVKCSEKTISLLEEKESSLVQRNSDLENRVENSAKFISSLKQKESSLVYQNTDLKSQVETSVKSISTLKQKESALVQKNSELEKELAESKKSVETLEREIKKEKKKVSINTTAKKASKNFLLIIRLLIMGFCLIGTAVCVFSGKIGIAVWFLINAVAIAPYLYDIIWNKISLPFSLKIAVEIITPIIASASIIIFYGGE